jgi:hypothetical protein
MDMDILRATLVAHRRWLRQERGGKRGDLSLVVLEKG